MKMTQTQKAARFIQEGLKCEKAEQFVDAVDSFERGLACLEEAIAEEKYGETGLGILEKRKAQYTKRLNKLRAKLPPGQPVDVRETQQVETSPCLVEETMVETHHSPIQIYPTSGIDQVDAKITSSTDQLDANVKAITDQLDAKFKTRPQKRDQTIEPQDETDIGDEIAGLLFGLKKGESDYKFLEAAVKFQKEGEEADKECRLVEAVDLYSKAIEHFRVSNEGISNKDAVAKISRRASLSAKRVEVLQKVIELVPKAEDFDLSDSFENEENSPSHEQSTLPRPHTIKHSRQRVIGLETVNDVLSQAVIITRLRSGLDDRDHHIILIVGSPGAGKTTVIGHMCDNTDNVNFINVNGYSIMNETSNIPGIFGEARERRPCMICIDDIDLVDSNVWKQIETQLEKAEPQNNQKIVLVCTASCPWKIDKNLRDRFDVVVFAPLPNIEERDTMIRAQMMEVLHNLNDADFQAIADATEGFSHADIQVLVKTAGMATVRELQEATHFKPKPFGSEGWIACDPKDEGAQAMTVQGKIAESLTMYPPEVTYGHVVESLKTVHKSISEGEDFRLRNWVLQTNKAPPEQIALLSRKPKMSPTEDFALDPTRTEVSNQDMPEACILHDQAKDKIFRDNPKVEDKKPPVEEHLCTSHNIDTAVSSEAICPAAKPFSLYYNEKESAQATDNEKQLVKSTTENVTLQMINQEVDYSEGNCSEGGTTPDKEKHNNGETIVTLNSETLPFKDHIAQEESSEDKGSKKYNAAVNEETVSNVVKEEIQKSDGITKTNTLHAKEADENKDVEQDAGQIATPENGTKSKDQEKSVSLYQTNSPDRKEQIQIDNGEETNTDTVVIAGNDKTGPAGEITATVPDLDVETVDTRETEEEAIISEVVNEQQQEPIVNTSGSQQVHAERMHVLIKNEAIKDDDLTGETKEVKSEEETVTVLVEKASGKERSDTNRIMQDVESEEEQRRLNEAGNVRVGDGYEMHLTEGQTPAILAQDISMLNTPEPQETSSSTKSKADEKETSGSLEKSAKLEIIDEMLPGAEEARVTTSIGNKEEGPAGKTTAAVPDLVVESIEKRKTVEEAITEVANKQQQTPIVNTTGLEETHAETMQDMDSRRHEPGGNLAVPPPGDEKGIQLQNTELGHGESTPSIALVTKQNALINKAIQDDDLTRETKEVKSEEETVTVPVENTSNKESPDRDRAMQDVDSKGEQHRLNEAGNESSSSTKGKANEKGLSGSLDE